ncbi:hypothetical protein [Kocuria sp. UCD-OTCP]|uniref:hypothetical protein n=1 Tax=Kocuria sp. UCD-OTCP TaxID=1292021 RepID=UPI00036848F8|nr:hypothetical protein [Kocuria sp. UCD-OTCP]EYT54247.1 hypothetical protein H488_0104350 [Kocuria sp. UCD-OTCP]
MTYNDFFTDAQRHIESCTPSDLTLTRFEVVDDTVELTLALTPEALDRVLRTQLRTAGAPSDWNSPKASMGPGSPSWTFALELTELINERYFAHALLERHEVAVKSILTSHGYEETTVLIQLACTPGHLALSLLRLKAEHLRGHGNALLECPAA